MNIRDLTKDQRRELYEAVLDLAEKLTGPGRRPASDRDNRERDPVAENLTQEAFLRLDTTRPWDPSHSTTLMQHMFGILKSLLSHEREADKRRVGFERQAASEQEALSDAGRSAEVISLDRVRRERAEALAKTRVAELRVRVAGFELDGLILDLMYEGVTKRADLVRRTGRSLDEVKTSLARIRRHMNAILAAERGKDTEVP